jgi:protein-S-isoprenylcysteine O-methyltransferase Ste14
VLERIVFEIALRWHAWRAIRAMRRNDMQKAAIKSKTILGIVVTAVVALAPELGFSFSESDGEFITQSVDAALEAVGLALATWGRITAEARLRFF